MRKTILFLCLILIINQLPTRALSASSAIVIDGANNRVLYEHHAYEQRSMASTTKIMTALCALEEGNLEDIVTVSAHAAAVEGSSIWLEAGEKITLKSLLIGLLLSSGNDAATAIAEHISGSEEEFAKRMTKKAHDIGAIHTQFKNPHGLDAEGHYTTAYDLAIITSYAMKNPVFSEIVKTEKATIEWQNHSWGRTLTNHNKLLRIYDGCDGVKTGYTKKTGRCLVSSATRDGMRLIVVTLNDPDDWNDHVSLLNRCFDEYPVRSLCAEEEHMATLPIVCGDKDYLLLRSAENVQLRLNESERKKLEVKYSIPESVEAPVAFGTVIGRAEWHLNGQMIADVPLVSSEHIDYVKPTHPLYESFYKISIKWLNLPEKKVII